ncbi:hypothetical protein FCS82_05365 [Oenococcus sp. UCMA 14587]|nr:hypothetical protein [Oenococcus sp. UCMA 14587]
MPDKGSSFNAGRSGDVCVTHTGLVELKGILSHDFQPNPIYDEVTQTGTELERLSDHIVNLKAHAEVAFLASNRSLTAINCFPYSDTKNYNDLFRALYDQFYKLNIRTDIKDEHHIHLSDYKLVVVPALYSVSDEFLKALNDYVGNGGHLRPTKNRRGANFWENEGLFKVPSILGSRPRQGP